MLVKTLRAMIIVVCSATTFYVANIAPTTAYAIGSATSGSGAGRG